MKRIAAAILRRNDKILICRRGPGGSCGYLWEFPGGKIEPGETGEDCAVRECREELGVTVAVGERFMEVDHTYPDLTVHLTLFYAAIREGIPQKLEHNDIRWITVGEIDQ